MNPLSDSPQQAHSSLSERALNKLPQSPDTQSDPLPSHVARSSSDSELASSDKLSALPDSPLTRARVVSRVERQGIGASQSAHSLEGLISHSAIPSIVDHDIPRLTASEGSIGKGSPFQRVSFGGAPSRVPSPPNHSPRAGNTIHHPLLRDSGAPPSRAPLIDSALSRLRRTSDPSRPPSIFRIGSQTPRKGSYDVPSTPQSRAASPMRIFRWTGFNRRETREEPFVPENPFQRRSRNPPVASPEQSNPETVDPGFRQWLPHPITCIPFKTSRKFLRSSRYFLLDTIPRQVYLHLLLRLPSLYFSRIARVYEDAELSRPDIQRLVDACAPRPSRSTSSPIPPGYHYPRRSLPLADEWTTANVSPALVRFKNSWEEFIDSLLREWKTLNLVSALLLSAILSMFQNTEMAQDPVIRTAALLSLTSALMSLSYGCVYIIRFATMRTMYKATRWAEEARKTTTFIWWNVWVLLAMPAVWLAWAMIFFITAILSFVWRSGAMSDSLSPTALSSTAVVGPRVAISSLFLIGLAYFMMIVKTLQNYGHTRDIDGEIRLLEPDEAQVRSSAEVEREREREEQGRRAPLRPRGRPRVKGEGRTRHDADRPSEGGVLSAVTGLGLTNLDGIPLSSSPRSSGEVSREKEKAVVSSVILSA